MSRGCLVTVRPLWGAANGAGNAIIVLDCKLADLVLPEKVDVVICGGFGYTVVNGGTAEDFVRARDAHLKPGGLLFPTRATVYAAAYTDEALYAEQVSKTTFWGTKDCYELDVSCLTKEALADHLAVTILGIFPQNILLTSVPCTYAIDFRTVTAAAIGDLTIPLDLACDKTGVLCVMLRMFRDNSGSTVDCHAGECHGIALWFDLLFDGSDESVVLSTAPTAPYTHWYQIRLLFDKPLAVTAGQSLTGSCQLLSSGRPQTDAKFSRKFALCASAVEL